MSGFEFNSIGYGDKVIMPASSAGSDSTKEAVFGVKVRQLSAHPSFPQFRPGI
jgi:hypothetical protein